MTAALRIFEGALIQGIEWDSQANPSIIIDLEDRQINLSFTGVVVFHMYKSQAKDIFRDNEIWKIEEADNSSFKKNTVISQSNYWLGYKPNDFYTRAQRVNNPDNIKHIIIMADYIDIEIVCTGYSLQPIDSDH